MVTLRVIIDTRDLSSETRYTDSRGLCKFKIVTGESIQNGIGARKAGYYPCYSTDSADKEVSIITLSGNPEKDQFLYITYDSTLLLDYYRLITPHYQIDTLITLLRSDSFTPQMQLCLPYLTWDDIPKLLAIGNDRTKITTFTRNPISSYYQRDCYLGIYALWLIESIRLSEGKAMLSPFDRFPSQFPILIQNEEGKYTMAQNTLEEMETAFEAYKKWWEVAGISDRKEACGMDPFENTHLYW
jgi:hypothetical protein